MYPENMKEIIYRRACRDRNFREVYPQCIVIKSQFIVPLQGDLFVHDGKVYKLVDSEIFDELSYYNEHFEAYLTKGAYVLLAVDDCTTTTTTAGQQLLCI